MEKQKKTETTLGDLIVALTDEAARIAPDEHEAYRLVAVALRSLYYNRGARARKLAIVH